MCWPGRADPALRTDWRADWLARLEAEPWLAPRWAGHQARDAYWKHGSVCEDYARMTVPVLSWGGWADNYMNTVSHLVQNVPAPVKGIVGPWVHQYPHTAVPGPRVGFLQVALRWWDRWLKGVSNGAEADPAYRVYRLDSEAPDASAKHRAGTEANLAANTANQIPDLPALDCHRLVQLLRAVRAVRLAGCAIGIASAVGPVSEGDETFFSASSKRALAT